MCRLMILTDMLENDEMIKGRKAEMREPALVIMAAGMGSRYGGLKQIDPVDGQGQIIIDYSIYDAVRAGFKKVVFIIKKQNEKDFRDAIGSRVEGHVDARYVFQELDRIPEGFQIPEGRVKPWGTGHAILCCKDMLDGPFMVINADDYYGRSAFASMYAFLTSHEDDDQYRYAMMGYILENTLTENGYVARGVCTADGDGYLTDITERTHIEKKDGKVVYTEDEGHSFTELAPDSLVSMNMWGFSNSILKELEAGFPAFLRQGLKENPLKCEYFLPSVVSSLIEDGKATVSVLRSADRWFGVTYKEDKAAVAAAVRAMKEKGLYPEHLWD